MQTGHGAWSRTLSVKSAQPRIVTDNKVWQSVSGKRKPCLPSKSALEDTCTCTNNVIGMYRCSPKPKAKLRSFTTFHAGSHCIAILL